MKDYAIDKDLRGNILKHVREGLDVLDAEGKRIGKVRSMYFGASSPQDNEQGTGAVTAPSPRVTTESWVDGLANAFAGETEIPEVIQARLRTEGFVRIDSAGLFKSDRFALPEQISAVDDQHMHLNVRGDELIHG